MDQYIHDNTDDEITHAAFLNAYLTSKGAEPVNLDQFRTLPSSQATGPANRTLTNLMQLTVDTSFWTRYRSDSLNPTSATPSRKPSRPGCWAISGDSAKRWRPHSSGPPASDR